MKDILSDIVQTKLKEVEQFKNLLPEPQLHAMVEPLLGETVGSLAEALRQSATGIISEFKRRSPSKGWISEQARADIVPLSYQQAGAAAVSILTDREYFAGHDEFIRVARASGVTIPILYKNFIVDEYQLFMARQCGASAVLLIAACLDKNHCRQLMATARELGMEVLLEMHSPEEAEYAHLSTDGVVCGVNNRNLGSFVTDVENSFRMAELLPAESVKVSESGLKTAATIAELRRVGYRGFLIGESLMSCDNPGQALKQLITEIEEQQTISKL